MFFVHSNCPSSSWSFYSCTVIAFICPIKNWILVGFSPSAVATMTATIFSPSASTSFLTMATSLVPDTSRRVFVAPRNTSFWIRGTSESPNSIEVILSSYPKLWNARGEPLYSCIVLASPHLKINWSLVMLVYLMRKPTLEKLSSWISLTVHSERDSMEGTNWTAPIVLLESCKPPWSKSQWLSLLLADFLPVNIWSVDSACSYIFYAYSL